MKACWVKMAEYWSVFGVFVDLNYVWFDKHEKKILANIHHFPPHVWSITYINCLNLSQLEDLGIVRHLDRKCSLEMINVSPS